MNAPKDKSTATQKSRKTPAKKQPAKSEEGTQTQSNAESTLTQSEVKALGGHHVNVGAIGHVDHGKTTLQQDVEQPSDKEVIDEIADEHANNADVLLAAVIIKAKSPNGFWRCQRHWSKQGNHAFVVPQSEDIEAIRAENPEFEAAFLTEDEYERIENEPNLVVELVEHEEKTEPQPEPEQD